MTAVVPKHHLPLYITCQAGTYLHRSDRIVKKITRFQLAMKGHPLLWEGRSTKVVIKVASLHESRRLIRLSQNLVRTFTSTLSNARNTNLEVKLQRKGSSANHPRQSLAGTIRFLPSQQAGRKALHRVQRTQSHTRSLRRKHPKAFRSPPRNST